MLKYNIAILLVIVLITPEFGWSAGYIGNATASLYSFCNTAINSFKLSRASDLCVQSTQEKLSLQSNGVQANWPLWSFKKPGARQIPLPAATFVRVVSWSALLKYSICPEAMSRC